MYILPDTHLLTLKQVAQSKNQATFEIEPLAPGFGVTLGNALRRILLTSIEGTAVSSARIDGVTHEFTTLPGVREDMINLTLNLKQIRLRSHSDEPTSLVLTKKGPGVVTVGDFKPNSQVEFVDPSQVIATLDKGAQLTLEVEVRKGRGYISTDARKEEKLPLGTIALDSIFSPVTRVTYDIENTRVGNVTNYDKITMTITTDGSITPHQALETAAKVAVEHFSIIGGVTTELGGASEAAALAVTAEDSEAAPKKRGRKKAAEEAVA